MPACHLGFFLATLLFLALSPLQASEDLLHTLRPEHPRVLATAEDFEQLQLRRASEAKLAGVLASIEGHARTYLDAPLLKREQIGKRLLAVSREALERVSTLAMAYRMTGEERFARRAEAELVNVCEFSDWNPSHFLDTAEMAAAVGIGYDWLYDELSPGTREKLRTALREKALVLVNNDYWWQTCDHNWNSVCYGGLTVGAMAVAEHEPELASELLRQVQENNPRAVAAYGPDGVYPEGPGYWSYGSTYQALLVSSLRTALGTDLGLVTPSLLASGNYLTHSFGPSGQTFNFSDGGAGSSMPMVLRWFAQEADMPAWVRLSEHLTPSREGGRLLAIQALWMAPERSGPERSDGPELPLSWHGGGVQPVAMFRSSWSDPDAMYLAVKGGSAQLNHAHMDAGSFVFDADGIRWAIDLGKVDYHEYEQRGVRLFDRGEGGDRWDVFRYVNMAHNTLTVGGKRFKVYGHADIVAYEPLEDGVGRAQVDMSQVIRDAAAASREFTFDVDARSVTIVDRLEGLKPGTSVRWTMITRATPTVDGAGVTLAERGKSLHLAAQGATQGEWTTESYRPPEGFYAEDIEGVRMVWWNARADASGRCDVAVKLQPSRSVQE